MFSWNFRKWPPRTDSVRGMMKANIKLYTGTMKGILHDLTEHVDLAPTLLDLAGVEIPLQFSGKPLLRDLEHITGKECIFGERVPVKDNIGLHRIWIRTNDYSLNCTWFNKEGTRADGEQKDGFVADLKKDPAERYNVYHAPEYAAAKEKLERIIWEWSKNKTEVSTWKT